MTEEKKKLRAAMNVRKKENATEDVAKQKKLKVKSDADK